jgi:endonuclease/exonuclease/phosphatase family metal-dependent hydrolase
VRNRPRSLPLSVLTFNVFHDYPSCRHFDSRLGILENGLAAERPDFAILQEVSVSEAHGHLPERLVAGLRDRGLHYSLAYAPANGSIRDGGTFEEGSAILSRWPIAESEVRRLAAHHVVEREHHGYRYEEYRIALRAGVVIEPGFSIDVFGTHVTDVAPRERISPRRLQIEDLARFVAERPNRRSPAIVGGDFNARPEAEEIDWLREQGFQDLCAENEPGHTNDADDRDLEGLQDTANQRIDYLFVAGAAGQVSVRCTRLFLAQPAEVEPRRFLWASDHSGILGELELKLEV